MNLNLFEIETIDYHLKKISNNKYDRIKKKVKKIGEVTFDNKLI